MAKLGICQEVCRISKQNICSIFSQREFGFMFAIRQAQSRREPDRYVPSNDPSRPLFTSQKREVLLRQGIFYCSSGQMGRSGVVFGKAKNAKISGEKSKKVKKANGNFRGSTVNKTETLQLFEVQCDRACDFFKALLRARDFSN